ncbi:MAG: hypothetical protein Tsb002_27370 [Wenzhouxiangellaceae bacterium]
MQGTPIQNYLYNFTLRVTFHADGSEPDFQLFFDGKAIKTIEIDDYMATLVFQLQAVFDGIQSPGTAVYGTQFQWLDLNGAPVNSPDAIHFIRMSDNNVTMTDCNTLQNGEVNSVFRFLFSVVYQGRQYSSHDPIIINKKPPA